MGRHRKRSPPVVLLKMELEDLKIIDFGEIIEDDLDIFKIPKIKTKVKIKKRKEKKRIIDRQPKPKSMNQRFIRRI